MLLHRLWSIRQRPLLEHFDRGADNHWFSPIRALAVFVQIQKFSVWIFGCHWKPNTHQFPKARKESLDLEIDICGRRDISYHVIPHKLKARIYQPSSQRTGLKSQPPVRSRECPCLRKDVRGGGSVQQEGKVWLHCPLPLGQVSSIFLIGVISLIFFHPGNTWRWIIVWLT